MCSNIPDNHELIPHVYVRYIAENHIRQVGLRSRKQPLTHKRLGCGSDPNGPSANGKVFFQVLSRTT